MKRFFKNIGLLTIFVFMFILTMSIVGTLVYIFAPEGCEDFNFMLLYFTSMIAVYNLTVALEKVVFKNVAPVYNSRVGFNPVTILLGVVLIFSISVVLLPLEEMLSADSRTFPDGPLTLLTVVVLAPIFEEMIFRARLYNILSRNSSPLMSASLSALAFGVVHMEPIVIIEALFVGVVLSYYYVSKRSIFTPIVLHMCNNAFAYSLAMLSYKGVSLRELIGSSTDVHLAAYIACSVVVLAGTLYIVRFFVKEKRRMRGIECQDMETIADHLDSNQLVE